MLGVTWPFSAALFAFASARLLGAEGFGAVSFYLALWILLLSPITYGAYNFVVKQHVVGTSSSQSSAGPADVRRVLRTFYGAFAFAATAVWTSVLAANAPVYMWTGLCLLFFLPVVAYGNERIARLHASGLSSRALFLGKSLPYISALVACLAIAGWVGNPTGAALIIVSAYLVPLFANGLLEWFEFSRGLPAAKARRLSSSVPLKRSDAINVQLAQLAGVGILLTLRGGIDILVAKLLFSEADVGRYALALKIAQLVGLPSTLLGAYYAPVIARAVNGNFQTDDAHVLRRATRYVVLAALLAGTFLVIYGERVLMLFGEDFSDAAPVLLILVALQVVVAFIGPVGPAAALGSLQPMFLLLIVLSTTILASVSYALAEDYGLLSIAIGSSLATLCLHVALLLLLRHRMKLTRLFVFL